MPSAAPRVGLVGAGRSRNGLGPFLAMALERAGCRVVAAAGRDLDAAGRGAAALAARLGHVVAACATPGELAGQVDAMVIAAPNAAHLDALEAALRAGLPCLCEKPLVTFAQTAAGAALVAGFEERGLLLMENCQWPFVLDGLRALYPELAPTTTPVPATTLAMGLGPMFRGRAMVEDSLSHVLSLAQAVAPIDPEAPCEDVRQDDPSPESECNVVRFSLRCQGGSRLAVAQHLQHTRTQPRPAWIELDGRRVDRRLGADYGWSLQTPDGRQKAVADPMHALVYRFAALLLRPSLDEARTHARAIRTRLRCYAGILAGLDAG